MKVFSANFVHADLQEEYLDPLKQLFMKKDLRFKVLCIVLELMPFWIPSIQLCMARELRVAVTSRGMLMSMNSERKLWKVMRPVPM